VRKATFVAVLAMVAVGVMAGAGSSAVSGAATINLSTHAGVVSYLRSLGIDPRGVVVQRGAHNYVGPSCPGRGWTCTTAKRVLQIAASPGGSNTFVCTGNTSTPPDCVIDQFSTTGANTATCQESSADPNASQSCQVRQENTSGANKLTITQAVNTQTGSSQSPAQYAGVIQSNDTGANTVTLGQGITALVNQVDGTGTQSQDASQGVYISQSSGAGANSTTVNQSQSLKAVAERKPSLTQNQNTDGSVNTNISLSQSSGAGANKATVNQSNVYVGNVQQAATAFQQQGSSGSSGEAEFFNQSSGGGANSIGGQQSESQTQRADQIGSLTQLQYGPLWADPDQSGGGAADKYNLGQGSTQNATNPTAQDDQEYAECNTDGTCTANQSVTQNGTTSTNTCTGTSCDIGNSVTFNGEEGHSSSTCNSSEFEGSCTPPIGEGTPEPPNSPPAFSID
jgi:hypothetical protein